MVLRYTIVYDYFLKQRSFGMNLTEFSSNYVYSAFIIFCRVSCMILLTPGFGENNINSRIKITFSFLITLIILPIVNINNQIIIPSEFLVLVLNVISELLLGIFFGLILRIILSSVNILGYVISNTIGLSAATLIDPTQDAQQGTIVGNFLTLLAIVLIFSFNLQHEVIQSIVLSYKNFKIGSFFEFYHDHTNTIVRVVNDSWNIAIKMSMAFIIIGLVINVVGGIISRIMPQIHVFFLIIPLQTMVGFLILAITVSSLMIWFIEHYKNYIDGVFG
ncbi:MAG: flagellar biosynthetic protein FliR [Candidatus Midichloriaceae bacterium]|jgi:flagellar biosynthetic protein FliR